MSTSSIYHFFNALSESHYERLLKMDYMGIGVMIFGMSSILIYSAFHNYKTFGILLSSSMVFLMALNMTL